MASVQDEVEREDLEYVLQQISHINSRIATVKKSLYMGDDYSSPHSITAEEIEDRSFVLTPQVPIHDCQICIELSAKAIFKCFGINPVERHDIDFSNDRVSGLLGRLPNEEDDGFSGKVPRVIFLTQFWDRFYTLSKYGIPEENISSGLLLNKSDAVRAIADADYCRETLMEAFNYVMDEVEFERSDLDLVAQT